MSKYYKVQVKYINHEHNLYTDWITVAQFTCELLAKVFVDAIIGHADFYNLPEDETAVYKITNTNNKTIVYAGYNIDLIHEVKDNEKNN